MRILHISDLHLGKTLNDISLIEDQKFVLLDQILNIIKNRKIDVLLISGDIFDKNNPPIEAIELYSNFLERCLKLNTKVIAISGNHDSSSKLFPYKYIFAKGGYYISSSLQDGVDKVVLSDKYGNVNFYLLPFTTPDEADKYYSIDYKDEKKYDSAIKVIINSLDIDIKERNIILSHQMVTGSTRSESDSLPIALTVSDIVSIENYSKFDYVALGHIHKKIVFKDGHIVYPGAILPYHKDEHNERYASYVELKAKGDFYQDIIPLEIKRPIVKIKGTIKEILSHNKIDDSFVSVEITDNVIIESIKNKIDELFPNLISLKFANQNKSSISVEDVRSNFIEPFDIIKDFYQQRTGKNIDNNALEIIEDILNKVSEENKQWSQ